VDGAGAGIFFDSSPHRTLLITPPRRLTFEGKCVTARHLSHLCTLKAVEALVDDLWRVSDECQLLRTPTSASLESRKGEFTKLMCNLLIHETYKCRKVRILKEQMPLPYALSRQTGAPHSPTRMRTSISDNIQSFLTPQRGWKHCLHPGPQHRLHQIARNDARKGRRSLLVLGWMTDPPAGRSPPVYRTSEKQDRYTGHCRTMSCLQKKAKEEIQCSTHS
jgi:hypothetical protein